MTQPCSLQLVATYHCDQAYSFDVSGTGACSTVFSSSANNEVAEASGGSSDVIMEDAEPVASASKQAQGMPTRQGHSAASAAASVITCLCAQDYHATCMFGPAGPEGGRGAGRGVNRLCIANRWSLSMRQYIDAWTCCILAVCCKSDMAANLPGMVKQSPRPWNCPHLCCPSRFFYMMTSLLAASASEDNIMQLLHVLPASRQHLLYQLVLWPCSCACCLTTGLRLV